MRIFVLFSLAATLLASPALADCKADFKLAHDGFKTKHRSQPSNARAQVLADAADKVVDDTRCQKIKQALQDLDEASKD